MNADVSFTFKWLEEPPMPPPVPVPDTRLSRMPPRPVWLLHDFSVDDGAHNKPPYEPRGHDLPETEKLLRPDYIVMDEPKARLWFDLFSLCAPPNLEKLPADLRIGRDLEGNSHIWLDDLWYTRTTAVEQWWLFLIYWSRAFTNKKSIDLPEYFDPVTLFGNLGGKPFEKEGVVTCGNVFYEADAEGAGTPIWCLDATPEGVAEWPSAEKLLEYAWLVHPFTISTTANHNPTPLPNAPKGTWDVLPAGYFNGNPVPVPLFSSWTGKNARTMKYEGIPLRVNWLSNERISREPVSLYVPERTLFPY